MQNTTLGAAGATLSGTNDELVRGGALIWTLYFWVANCLREIAALSTGGTKWKPYQNLTNTGTLQATMIPPLPTPGIWQASLCDM